MWVEENLALQAGPGGLVEEYPWQPYPEDPNAGMAALEACPHPTGQDIYEHLTGAGTDDGG